MECGFVDSGIGMNEVVMLPRDRQVQMWEVWADLYHVWVSEMMTYVLLHGFL